jgi:hypothetical protein
VQVILLITSTPSSIAVEAAQRALPALLKAKKLV